MVTTWGIRSPRSIRDTLDTFIPSALAAADWLIVLRGSGFVRSILGLSSLVVVILIPYHDLAVLSIGRLHPIRTNVLMGQENG